MSDPATLIDCPFCDATNWPDDEFCHVCKKSIWTQKQIDNNAAAEKYEKQQYQEYLILEIDSELADGNQERANVLFTELEELKKEIKK